MIDLHSHTTASDGELEPAQLVERAARSGITTLAVTDHDTVSGLAACTAVATRLGLRLIPGIELSAFLGRREIHILGHFVDALEPGLASFSARLRDERHLRMEAMVAKARALGFPVTLEQVRQLAGPAHLTRPHLGRVLVELGYCSSLKEAFDRFLRDGGPMWVERYKLSAADAIELIHRARGTATLAHPGPSKVERIELAELRAAGLDGLEVLHSDHPPSQREKLTTWASELDLIPTAGSDFHGPTVSPDRELGTVSMLDSALKALELRRPPPRA